MSLLGPFNGSVFDHGVAAVCELVLTIQTLNRLFAQRGTAPENSNRTFADLAESQGGPGSDTWHEKDQMQVLCGWRHDTTWYWSILFNTLEDSIDNQAYTTAKCYVGKKNQLCLIHKKVSVSGRNKHQIITFKHSFSECTNSLLYNSIF